MIQQSRDTCKYGRTPEVSCEKKRLPEFNRKGGLKTKGKEKTKRSLLKALFELVKAYGTVHLANLNLASKHIKEELSYSLYVQLRPLLAV